MHDQADSVACSVAHVVLRLCSGMLTPSSGKSGSCSCLEAKTEPAKENSSMTFVEEKENL